MKDEYLRSRRLAKQLSHTLTEQDIPSPLQVTSLSAMVGHQTRLCGVTRLQGGRIASISYDGIVRVYKRNETTPYLTTRVPIRQVSCICAVRDENDVDNEVLVVGGADGRIVTLRGRDGYLMCTIRFPRGPQIRDVWSLRSGHIVVAARYDLFLVSHNNGRGLRRAGRIRNAHGRNNTHVAEILGVSCAHNALVTKGSDWAVNVWDPVTLQLRARLLHTAHIVDVLVTPTLIVTASSRGEVRLYHNLPNACTLFRVLNGIHNDSPIVSLGLMRLGRTATIMVASENGKLAFIDEKGERCLALVSTPAFVIGVIGLQGTSVLIGQPTEPYCSIASLPNSILCERPAPGIANTIVSSPIVPTALIAVTVLGIVTFYVSRRRA